MSEEFWVPLEPDMSWSEQTSPSSDDLIESIIRPTPPTARPPRIMRKPAQRRREAQQARMTSSMRTLQTFSISPTTAHAGEESHRHPSDASMSSTFTVFTASTSSTDQWSTSGFVEEEEAMEMDTPSLEPGDSPNVLLEPKIESPEAGFQMDDLETLDTPTGTEGESSLVQVKRPRGRPRKHPILTLEENAKVVKGKGRTKTGCITCRERKKKCDEKKPECENCERNNYKCGGYPERRIWKSPKERKDEEVRVVAPSLSTMKLPPIIHGIVNSRDRMFLEHYCYRLSAVLTVEGTTKNAFKHMLLPMAVQHLGLMHSILALSSTNIDYQEPYGRELLQKYPDVTVAMLEQSSQFHQEEALKEFNLDIKRQQEGVVQDGVLSVRYGQMLCLVVQSISEGKSTGEHRIHLQAYQRLMGESQPEEGPFMEFINEYFQFHIAADQIISLPQGRARLGGITDDFDIPKGVIPSTAVRLLGVQDGLFFYMSKITNLRNTIRDNMEQGREPVVDYETLYRAAEIDAGIREWEPSWPRGDDRDLAGLLYRQMMWVYLYRTIYPPRTRSWARDSHIKEAVDTGIQYLGLMHPSNQQQTLLMAPTFIFGCAAFEPEQRPPILEAIKIVRGYTHLKNGDCAVQVLERVWKFMDDRDERSWDWQSVAHEMGLDFLAT